MHPTIKLLPLLLACSTCFFLDLSLEDLLFLGLRLDELSRHNWK